MPVRYSRAVTVPALEFRGVSFTRGPRPVLREVSFSIAEGETVALVGRSGAGKTTILKLINRLLLPQTGDVLVSGRSTRDWDPFVLRRSCGYVLQEIGLFPHLTVGDNVALVPRLCRWDDGRVARRVDEVLALTGLAARDFAARPPAELSGGQRQRVGVARALAADPSILLMDEPFGALDPITRSELHRELRRIQREIRKTIVLVTHDILEAFALATRIGVLVDGELAALADPAEIGRSEDPRVRSLLEPFFEARTALESTRR